MLVLISLDNQFVTCSFFLAPVYRITIIITDIEFYLTSTISNYLINDESYRQQVDPQSSSSKTVTVKTTQEVALVSSSQQDKKKQFSSKICEQCGRSGHLIDNCWVKYPKKNPYRSANQPQERFLKCQQ